MPPQVQSQTPALSVNALARAFCPVPHALPEVYSVSNSVRQIVSLCPYGEGIDCVLPTDIFHADCAP